MGGDGGKAKPLTDDEINTLREMADDFEHAKWFKGQLKWWGIWVLGLPTASLTIWKALDELYHRLMGLK